MTRAKPSKWQLFKRMIRAYRDPDCFGDFGLLKMELFGGIHASPDVVARMSGVIGYHPRIDVDELAQLPTGRLGREFADHMRRCDITPLNVSPDLEPIAQRHVVGLRYLATHDIVHAILGFDTSYAGEMGVYAFAAAQGYSRDLTWVYRFARIAYPALNPTKIGNIRRARAWGWEIGRKAKFLLGYKFEDNWHRPLADIRREFHITPAPTPDGRALALLPA